MPARARSVMADLIRHLVALSCPQKRASPSHPEKLLFSHCHPEGVSLKDPVTFYANTLSITGVTKTVITPATPIDKLLMAP